MDGYIQTINSLGEFDPQSLGPGDLDKSITFLKQQLLKTEAAKVLLPARESPLPRLALGRLSNLLNLVFKPDKSHEPKLAALRALDPVSLIICGLCLTQKAVDTMRKDLFDVLLQQAIIASQTMLKTIMKNEDINKVVLSSSHDEDFLNSYLNLRRMVKGPVRPSLQYSLHGSPSWCYCKTITPRSTPNTFPRLLSKAVHGYATTFLPSEESTDGLIRVMIMFDQAILRTLLLT
ncbi:hypothetical protein KXV56_001671 [Aspergillus fumigatus]|nr:hypothetical protein KXV56_001671 [Aspergillus fumigatus]